MSSRHQMTKRTRREHDGRRRARIALPLKALNRKDRRGIAVAQVTLRHKDDKC